MLEIKTKKKSNGRLIISNSVIAKLAGTAALEVDGVSIPADGHINNPLNKKTFSKRAFKWIKVDTEKNLEITVSIYIKSGYKLMDVSKNVQKKVKTEIETMTGFPVHMVNVNALGVTG